MRLFPWAVLSGICWCLLTGPSAQAQLFGKKPVKRTPAAAASQGLPGYIRKLTADARAAEQRGDLATARALAQRAYKISLTGKPMLVNDPDCSPQATAALAQELNGKADTSASSASVAQPAAAAAGQLDLNPLLDTTVQDAAIPLPPSPAPELEEARPAKPARPAAPTAAAKRAKSSGSASVRRDQIAQSPSKPAAKVRRKTSNSLSESQREAGFLALQTDWLASDADHVIEDLAKRPKTAPRPKPKSSVPRTAADDDDERDDEADSEVTTAIGEAEHHWELDIDADVSMVHEAAPQLSPGRQPTRRDAPADVGDGSLGVWSASSSKPDANTPQGEAVSLSDFLDPSGRRPGTAGDAPRMIETDFRQNAAPSVTTDAVNANPIGSAEIQPVAAPQGPAVSVQEGPALEWLDSSSAAAKRVSPAKMFPLDLAWSEWTTARKAVVAGMALLISGMVLFGLSFRWT